MAVRLSKAFGGSPEMRLRLQVNYDLAQIQQDRIEIKRYTERRDVSCRAACRFREI